MSFSPSTNADSTTVQSGIVYARIADRPAGRVFTPYVTKMFQSVTLKSAIAMSGHHSPARTRSDCPLRRARANIPTPPTITQIARKVQTGMSTIEGLIIGQFRPPPRLSMASSHHVERGRVVA